MNIIVVIRRRKLGAKNSVHQQQEEEQKVSPGWAKVVATRHVVNHCVSR